MAMTKTNGQIKICHIVDKGWPETGRMHNTQIIGCLITGKVTGYRAIKNRTWEKTKHPNQSLAYHQKGDRLYGNKKIDKSDKNGLCRLTGAWNMAKSKHSNQKLAYHRKVTQKSWHNKISQSNNKCRDKCLFRFSCRK